MIEALLPPAVQVSSVFGDLPGPPLFPQEAALIADSVESRRNEFATGRRLARQSLSRLGIADVPLLSGARGEPLWPDGVLGAITHCDGYRAAAVVRRSDLFSVGMDAERARPLPEGVFEAVSLPEERAAVAKLRHVAPEVPWEVLLFSAKESVYKTWFPLTGKFLEFEKARVLFDPERRTFTARLLVPGPHWGDSTLDGFNGRWAVREGFALTAIAVPTPPRD
ncbi:4'-phosphopantetheinyl transferase EntD [Streptomyces sp. 846.5]|nr:4'-phosphopantetheinyl transferase superfamily protein [Streptomyces sp. 846.5]TDT97675.1 4'-phosphopantetheinyl transferase EntD [Streptomyces sp. 846.5]